jgi:hypothetical protein
MPYANKEDRNTYLKQKRLIAKNALEKSKEEDDDEYETYDDIIVKPPQKPTDTATQKTDTGTPKPTDAPPKYRFY